LLLIWLGNWCGWARRGSSTAPSKHAMPMRRRRCLVQLLKRGPSGPRNSHPAVAPVNQFDGLCATVNRLFRSVVGSPSTWVYPRFRSAPGPTTAGHHGMEAALDFSFFHRQVSEETGFPFTGARAGHPLRPRGPMHLTTRLCSGLEPEPSCTVATTSSWPFPRSSNSRRQSARAPGLTHWPSPRVKGFSDAAAEPPQGQARASAGLDLNSRASCCFAAATGKCVAGGPAESSSPLRLWSARAGRDLAGQGLMLPSSRSRPWCGSRKLARASARIGNGEWPAGSVPRVFAFTCGHAAPVEGL